MKWDIFYKYDSEKYFGEDINSGVKFLKSPNRLWKILKLRDNVCLKFYWSCF